MRPEPVCPRCGSALRPPDLWSSAWRCERHGEVAPLQAPVPPSADPFTVAGRRSAVPLWLPWPLPSGWLVSGARVAGDDRAPARAAAVALSGPGLLGGPADMIVVSEEPGVGLGAGYAGMDETDPGPELTALPCDTKVTAGGHPTPLWSVPGVDDRCAYIGEAAGCWLWIVVWPVAEWMVIHDDLRLTDARGVAGLDIPFGAATSRLLLP